MVNSYATKKNVYVFRDVKHLQKKNNNTALQQNLFGV